MALSMFGSLALISSSDRIDLLRGKSNRTDHQYGFGWNTDFESAFIVCAGTFTGAFDHYRSAW
jgi:hypothetical protein